jgi:tetratricopeptide (TPR) repeat protein
MKTIFADFNAMTEAEQVRLTTRGSQEDILSSRLRPGDWTWLSDGELLVGARLAIDPRYGLVGEPAWDTLVHLDTEEAHDRQHVESELQRLMKLESPSVEEEAQFFRLSTQLERVAPPESVSVRGSYFAERRALALLELGRNGLAMLEIEAARLDRPDDPRVNFIYLELLRRENFPRAITEAESFANSPNTPAVVLSACIYILATSADEASDEQFRQIAARVLEWCDRLDRAPDLGGVDPPLIALTFFNRGLILLRSGRRDQAQIAFGHAHEMYPINPALEEATRLNVYDHHAREIALRAREIAERVLARPAA